MNYNATVQGTFYKMITAANTLAALKQLVADRDAGLITGYDSTKPANFSLSRA